MRNVRRIIFFLIVVAIGAAVVTYFYAMKREHVQAPATPATNFIGASDAGNARSTEVAIIWTMRT